MLKIQIFMKQIVTYIEQEELNGTMITLCQAYGHFMRRVEFLMDHIGIIGVLNKKFNGGKITVYG